MNHSGPLCSSSNWSLASQQLDSLAEDVNGPLEVQLGIRRVGEAVPRPVIQFRVTQTKLREL